MAKKKVKKAIKVEPFVDTLPKIRLKVNAGEYAKSLLKKRPVEDALLMVEQYCKKLIGKEQNIKNPSYSFWNNVRSTLLNIKDPGRKARILEKLGKQQN